MINENNYTAFINKINDFNISIDMWNKGIQDSFVASFYWTILWIILTAIISYIYYKYTNNIFNYNFIKFRKIFSHSDSLDGIYISTYSYKWNIKNEIFVKEKREYLNILKKFNNNDKEINEIINLMSKNETKTNNNKCWEKVNNYINTTTSKKLTKTLYKIEKLYSRRLSKENIIKEVIEIIFIKDKMYGFTIPNDCLNPIFRKVRHNSSNQNKPITFEEQDVEFRFFGKKQSENLFIGFWQDPDKNKRSFGSFTFIYPSSGTELVGKWLGEDKKSDKDINSGDWILKRKFKNYKEYYKCKEDKNKYKDRICQ